MFLLKGNIPDYPASIIDYLDPQLRTSQRNALNPIRNLPKRNVAREIRTAMLRLDIDGERREAAVVRGAQLVLCNPPAGLDQRVADLLWRLNSGIERVHDAYEGDLLDAVGVAADRGADLLVDLGLVLFAGELDQEVAGVDLEQGGEEGVVVDVVGMDLVGSCLSTSKHGKLVTSPWVSSSGRKEEKGKKSVARTASTIQISGVKQFKIDSTQNISYSVK